MFLVWHYNPASAEHPSASTSTPPKRGISTSEPKKEGDRKKYGERVSCTAQTRELPGILKRHETPKSAVILGIATHTVC